MTKQILIPSICQLKFEVDEVVRALNSLRDDTARCWGFDGLVGFETNFHDLAEHDAALVAKLSSGETVGDRMMIWKLNP